MWQIPLVLKTTPVPESTRLNDDDPRITYSGSWRSSRRRGSSYYNDEVHDTTAVNDFLPLTFRGTGIDYIAAKHTDLGNVDMYLDGALKQNVSFRLENFPRLSRVVVFRIDGLSEGRHAIEIVNKSTASAVVDAFRVYGGSAE